jgi:hypothetical protein
MSILAAKSKDINIREYKPQDAEKIYSLASKHTSFKRDAAFWVWINRLLSEEESIISVAELNNQIIGHYAIIPRICSIRGNRYKAGVAIHAIVDPDFRTSVSIFHITSHLYHKAKEKNIDFIFGFPNENNRLIQQRIEGWKKISLFNALEKEAVVVEHSKTVFSWESFDKENFDNLFILNELSEKYRANDNIFLLKPLTFLINRYLNHPQNPYQVWLLKDQNEYIGSVVTKLFKLNSEKRVHIIDFILSPSYSFENLIDDFEKIFSESVDKYVLWPYSNFFKHSLIDMNYTATGFDTFFGVKFLNDISKEEAEFIVNFNNWNLPMGDSDAF